ncbi:MAG: hypothetical protein ACRD3O_15260, partial [Terriglobia bacterium]
ANLLDPTFNSPVPLRQGYNYYMAVNSAPSSVPSSAANSTDDQTFDAAAVPVTVGTTGQRSFCDDQSGAILFDATGATGKSVAGVSCSADGFVTALGQ